MGFFNINLCILYELYYTVVTDDDNQSGGCSWKTSPFKVKTCSQQR